MVNGWPRKTRHRGADVWSLDARFSADKGSKAVTIPHLPGLRQWIRRQGWGGTAQLVRMSSGWGWHRHEAARLVVGFRGPAA